MIRTFPKPVFFLVAFDAGLGLGRHAALDAVLLDLGKVRLGQGLYSHQAESVALAAAGRSFVVQTPTASGKTLCYNLPVLNSILEEGDARALYLFPTKALSQDQLAEFRDLSELAGMELSAAVYDGDTPGDARRAAREECRIVLTNPDMLHSGVLPYHAKWSRFLANLNFVVIDEIHAFATGKRGDLLALCLARLQAIAPDMKRAALSATVADPARPRSFGWPWPWSVRIRRGSSSSRLPERGRHRVVRPDQRSGRCSRGAP